VGEDIERTNEKIIINEKFFLFGVIGTSSVTSRGEAWSAPLLPWSLPQERGA
jgi:hypothetical protein